MANKRQRIFITTVPTGSGGSGPTPPASPMAFTPVASSQAGSGRLTMNDDGGTPRT